MVDLPVPQPQLVTSEAPQFRGEDAFQRTPRQSIAPGLEQAGQGADDLSISLAKQQAGEDLKSVTLNPDGSVKVQNGPAFIFGDAGRAYEGAMGAGIVAQQRTAVQSDMADMATKFAGNPQGFQQEAQKYLQARAASNPGQVGAAILQDGGAIAEQHYAGLVNQKREIDLNQAKGSILAQINDHKNQLYALAAQGGSTTPDFLKKQDELNGLYDSLGANPLFQVGPDKAVSEKQNASDLFRGAALVSQVDTSFNKKGKASAQQMLTEGILNNAGLNLTEAQRNSLYRTGMSRLQFLTDSQQGAIAASKDATNQIVNSYHDGKPPSEEIYDQTVTHLTSIGDTEGVMKVQAAHKVWTDQGRTTQGLTPEQSFNSTMTGGRGVGALNFVYSGPLDAPGAPGSVPPNQLYGYLKSQGASNNEALLLTSAAANESSLVPTTIHDKGIGYGLWGHNGTRLAAMRASNGDQALSWQDQAKFALGELRSRPEGQAANAAQSPEQLVNAEMAYEQPQGYKAGSPQTGHNYTGRLNTIRKFTALTGEPAPAQSTPPSVNGVHYTDAEIAANPYLLSESIRVSAADQGDQVKLGRQVGAGLEQSIKAGIEPAPQTLANFRQLAQQNPAEFGPQMQRIETGILGNHTAALAMGMPAGQGQALIDQSKQLAQGGSIYQAQLARATQDAWTRGQARLKTDPHGEAAALGWIPRVPPPLDPTDANAFNQAVTERRAAGAAISSRLGGAPASAMFSPADKKGIATFLAATDGKGAANMMNGLLTNLQPQEADSLFASKDVTDAVRGMARSGDPGKMGAAYSAMDALYRRNPQAFQAEFGQGALSDLRVWQQKLAFMPPDQIAKDMQRADDPNVINARKQLEKQADAGPLKNMTPSAIVSKFSGWLPGSHAYAPVSEAPAQEAMALKNDYDQSYKEMYGKTGDPKMSDSFAQERVQMKWGISGTNGNRLMQYPPEKYYPPVGGSHGWIKAQLDDDVHKAAGEQGVDIGVTYYSGRDEPGQVTMPVSGAQQRAVNVAAGEHDLVGDQTTQAEIAGGRPPSYQVVVQDAKGQYHRMESSAGVPLRFRPDHGPALAKARAQFETRREGYRDEQQQVEPLNNTSIAPGL